MRLNTQVVAVAAPRELVFDVIASAGKNLGATKDGQLVEFETRWRGRVYKTVEAVSLDRPKRIAYRWVVGPLVGVEEEILLTEVDVSNTKVTYTGSFQHPKGFRGWLQGVAVVRPIFDRLVKSHLAEGKTLSEARAARSHVYPRNERS